MAKIPAAVDTTAGAQAHSLAVQYKAELTPRLPADIVANLAADLTTLGAEPIPAQPSNPTQPAPVLPSLAEAMAAAVTLITALHEAIHGAKPRAEVRKAYGVSSKTPSKEASSVIAGGEKIVKQAQTNPTEALSLGILPSDVASLGQALTDLAAAETVAKGKSARAGSTGKARLAAESRMHEAVARISGVGVLAFATNPAVRAEFAALKPVKKL